MNITYNIHNLLKIKIENASWHLIKDLNFRYSYFEDNAITGPFDILVRIGPFKPDLEGCICLDRKFYIRKNYIYLRDSDKNLNWEAQIFDIEEGCVRIDFRHGFKNYFRFPWGLFPDLIMELYILQPLIELKLSLKGFLLLHAGAVCKEDKAVLFIARGGSGKTQAVIDLMRRGFELISDDMVVLNGSRVLSLPLSPGLFTFCYDKIKKEDLSLVDKFRLFRYLLDNDRQLIRVIDSARLKHIFIVFLSQKNTAKIRALNIEEAVDHLIWNQRTEKTAYVSYKYMIGSFLKAYEYAFPEVDFYAAQDRVKTELYDQLAADKIRVDAIELPSGESISDLACAGNLI